MMHIEFTVSRADRQPPAAPPDPRRRLLGRFPPTQRAFVANAFLSPARAGHQTPKGVLSEVARAICRRVDRASRWADRDAGPKARAVLDAINADPDAALDFARWAIEWSLLPKAERDRRKHGRSRPFIEAKMAKLPLTDKQLHYLARLGCNEPVASRLEASQMIDRLTAGRSGS